MQNKLIAFNYKLLFYKSLFLVFVLVQFITVLKRRKRYLKLNYRIIFFKLAKFIAHVSFSNKIACNRQRSGTSHFLPCLATYDAYFSLQLCEV